MNTRATSLFAALVLLGALGCAQPQPQPPQPPAASPATAGGILSGSPRPATQPSAGPQADLAEADKLLLAGRYADAEALAQKLRAAGRSGSADVIMSRAAYAKGRFEDATRYAQSALASGEPGLSPRMVDLDLFRASMITDTAAAVKLMQGAVEKPGPTNSASRVALADAILLEAARRAIVPVGETQRTAQKVDRAAVARQAREVLAPMKAEADRSRFAGDYYAVLGNAAFFEGDLPQAEKMYSLALARGVGMDDRASDLYNALGWVRFLRGDRDGVRQAYRQATRFQLKMPGTDVWSLLPKYENYLISLTVLGGEPLDPKVVDAAGPIYRKVREAGVEGVFTYEMYREWPRVVLGALQRGSYADAFVMVWGQWSEAIPGLYLSTGEASCFYSVAVEERAISTAQRLVLADLARREGRAGAERWLLEDAKKITGDVGVVKQLLAKAPKAQGKPRLGIDPDEFLRTQARLARDGYLIGLYYGMLGTQTILYDKLVERSKAGDTTLQTLRVALEAADSALSRGAKFEPAFRGVDPAEGTRTTLDYGSGELVLEMRSGMWRLAEAGGLPMAQRWFPAAEGVFEQQTGQAAPSR